MHPAPSAVRSVPEESAGLDSDETVGRCQVPVVVSSFVDLSQMRMVWFKV